MNKEDGNCLPLFRYKALLWLKAISHLLHLSGINIKILAVAKAFVYALHLDSQFSQHA